MTVGKFHITTSGRKVDIEEIAERLADLEIEHIQIYDSTNEALRTFWKKPILTAIPTLQGDKKNGM